MKVTIDLTNPTAEQLSAVLGRRVTELRTFPGERMELDVEGETALTQNERQALADKLNLDVSRIT